MLINQGKRKCTLLKNNKQNTLANILTYIIVNA